MSAEKSRSIKCPQCGEPADLGTENSHRPFCSQRCKLIDMGAWASESYRIPVEEAPAAETEENATKSD